MVAEEVEAFKRDYMFSKEAAVILEIGMQDVLRWMRDGRLVPISGPAIDKCHRYLFRRVDIEQLRPANRLTLPEMTEVLGVPEWKLRVMIQRGEIVPFSGPGVDRSGQFLFLRDAHLLS